MVARVNYKKKEDAERAARTARSFGENATIKEKSDGYTVTFGKKRN